MTVGEHGLPHFAEHEERNTAACIGTMVVFYPVALSNSRDEWRKIKVEGARREADGKRLVEVVHRIFFSSPGQSSSVHVQLRNIVLVLFLVLFFLVFANTNDASVHWTSCKLPAFLFDHPFVYTILTENVSAVNVRDRWNVFLDDIPADWAFIASRSWTGVFFTVDELWHVALIWHGVGIFDGV